MNEDRSWCVYLHTNKINNKKYVGLTCNIETRFGKNGNGYLHRNFDGNYVQPLFARAIVKYGWNSFETKILKDNLTLKEANELEEYYINLWDLRNTQKGYNIRPGGSHGKLSEETKEKLRECMLGRYDGENNPFYGKTHTEETKKIIGNKNKVYAQQRDFSGENNPMYGKKLTEEQKKHLSEIQKGKRHTEETKQKISEKNKKYYQTHVHHCKGVRKTEEQKEHMREIMLGREMSDEWKKNIGKAHSKFTYICVETEKEYYSSGEAMRDTGIDKASIRRAADGQQKTAGGLHWIKKLKNKENIIES